MRLRDPLLYLASSPVELPEDGHLTAVHTGRKHLAVDKGGMVDIRMTRTTRTTVTVTVRVMMTMMRMTPVRPHLPRESGGRETPPRAGPRYWPREAGPRLELTWRGDSYYIKLLQYYTVLHCTVQ